MCAAATVAPAPLQLRSSSTADAPHPDATDGPCGHAPRAVCVLADFWYRYMSFAQERVFAQTLENRSNVVTWPQDATFAVGSAWIKEQPKWVYEVMHRLTTVELACMGAGTIMWAHSLERLWFELFDKRVPKTILPVVGDGHARPYDTRGTCFLGARRRRVRLR